MIITFYSNFLNHHQLPLCEELVQRNIDFTFVALEETPNAAKVNGYEDMNNKYNFVLRAYEDENKKEGAKKLLMESDVVIIGAAPTSYITKRLETDKITFLFTERFLKKGTWRRFIPKVSNAIMQRVVMHKNKKLYVLCASGYVSHDLHFFNYPMSKCFKWGYFPEVSELELEELQNIKQHSAIDILWVGRLIKLKRVKDIIRALEILIKKGYNVHLTIVGGGKEEDNIRQLIKAKKIESNITMLGVIPAKQVRKYMEKANIFTFTSDHHEGWGAVLNEAMSSACAVVASDAIGSVPFLIKNNENGLIYQCGNSRELSEKIEILLNDHDLCRKLGENAYRTIAEKWNASNAVESFLKLVKRINEKQGVSIFDGPCSNAEMIGKGWYNK